MRCCITSRVTPTVKTRPSGRQRRLLRPRPESHSVSLTSHKPNCPQTNLASSPTTSHQADSGRTTPDGAEGWRQANLRVNMGHRGVPGSSDGHHITTLRLARRPATSSERESLKVRSAQGSPAIGLAVLHHTCVLRAKHRPQLLPAALQWRWSAPYHAEAQERGPGGVLCRWVLLMQHLAAFLLRSWIHLISEIMDP